LFWTAQIVEEEHKVKQSWVVRQEDIESTENKNSKSTKIVCYDCKKEGHISGNCRNPSTKKLKDKIASLEDKGSQEDKSKCVQSKDSESYRELYGVNNLQTEDPRVLETLV
jgi:hypothetical protein